jgi:biopolymer transport protein ExbD
MPVHSAGPRLYRSVPFRFLVKHTGSASAAKQSNISMNLTPFVDMMTILVTFLLMVFNASGALLHAQAGLTLPDAERTDTLQDAPVIIVSKENITYQGNPIATVKEVLDDDTPTFKIEALYLKLDADGKKIKEEVSLGKSRGGLPLRAAVIKACEAAKAGVRSKDLCPDGLAILQADKDTDARLINKIVNTAKAAGFDNILFAAQHK